MFLVCGEALHDLFVEEETPAGLRIDARIGGSPFNVAVGLARLGRPAALLAGVETDALGDRLAAALASACDAAARSCSRRGADFPRRATLAG